MHGVATLALLASLAAATLAREWHGIFFASTDSNCLRLTTPELPTSDMDRGQLPEDVRAVRSQLPGCTLFFRQEIDGEIEEDPVLVIAAGDNKCYKLPESGLHWNVVCG
ncbi:hypothetical protein VUR80DRAFT_1124 [Thermomyces stellatus]